MYQQKGKSAFKGKLDNILGLSKHLDNPHEKFKSIHVAGTNGKGSSSHMLASVLQEAGYRVGLYTSPHLKDFRERIRINGTVVDEKFVVEFISENRGFLEEHQLSFFEMTVGMAFAFFAQEKVDIAIIEVGLGGRLDSTNIIVPEVSLITNIGHDHANILGDTLQKIAFEKAGIIKKGIPVVVSETQKETKGIFEAVAAEKQALLTFADQNMHSTYESDLVGSYQIKNIQGVTATLNKLKNYDVNENQLIRGLKNVVKNTGLMGRWQVIGQNPEIICDTAHNKEGLRVVLGQLLMKNFETLHIVMGFVKDKDLEGILPLFPKEGRYYFCCPTIQRGLDATALKEKALKFGLTGESFESVYESLKAAKVKAKKEDLIYIGGSTFVVAEVL